VTSEASPTGIILAGDDGRAYRFPFEAMERWRQPAGATTTGRDDPTYTSPDGTCYVIPRAEVEGYWLGEEENAAIRSQLEQDAGTEVTGYATSYGPSAGFPPDPGGCPPGTTIRSR
jgi:hypothetical protein